VTDEPTCHGPELPAWLQHPAVHAGFLALAVGLALWPALRAEFIWDDQRQIVDTDALDSLGRIPGYFTTGVWKGVGDAASTDEIELYRPGFLTALCLTYALGGGANPVVFHGVSLLCHLAVVLLVWGLARRWLGCPWFALGGALVFAFHPVIAEAYLFVSAMTDTLGAVGVLGATLLLDRLGTDGRARGAGARWGIALAAGLACLAGLLTKEVVVMALPPLVVWLWRRRGVALRYQVPLAGAVVAYAVLRLVGLGGLHAAPEEGSQRLAAVANAPLLLADGIRGLLTLQPVGYRELAFEYENVPPAWVAGSAVLVIAVIGAAVLLRRRVPLLAVGVAVFVLMLAPVVLVTTVRGWGGYGRYLYLPWAVLALGIAQGALAIETRLAPRMRRGHWIAVGLLVLTYLATQQVGLREALRVYHSNRGLAESAVLVAPNVGHGYWWVGRIHASEGDYETAVRFYDEAMSRTPDLYLCQRDQAIAHLWLGQAGAALDVALRSEAMGGPGPKSSFTVAFAYKELGRPDEAAERLLWALERAPTDPSLLKLQVMMLQEHPDPEGYRAWLDAQLGLPENAQAAGAIRPLLDDPSITDGG